MKQTPTHHIIALYLTHALNKQHPNYKHNLLNLKTTIVINTQNNYVNVHRLILCKDKICLDTYHPDADPTQLHYFYYEDPKVLEKVLTAIQEYHKDKRCPSPTS